MRIADVKSYVVGGRSLFVKVETDAGIHGWGECSPMNVWVEQAIVQRVIKPIVLGQDPFDIEKLYAHMVFDPYKIGPMGAHLEAVSGVDMALWDVLGKAVDKPVYKLLGGAYRARVQMYASFGRGGLGPKDAGDFAAALVDRGYEAVKMRMDMGMVHVDRWSVRETLEYARELRRGAGDKLLSFDNNNGLSPHRAIQVGRVLQDELNVFHYEEPVPAYDYPGLAQVAGALDMPVSAGEQEYTLWQFRDLITQGQVDIIQPDVTKAGGITGCRKIAVLGHAFDKPCTVHNTQPTLGTVASVHLSLATPNSVYPQEHNVGREPHVLIREGVVRNMPECVGGYMELDDAPGLGVEVDEEKMLALAE